MQILHTVWTIGQIVSENNIYYARKLGFQGGFPRFTFNYTLGSC
jgi:hypothetical protein